MGVHQCVFSVITSFGSQRIKPIYCHADYATHFLNDKNKTGFWPSVVPKGTLSRILTVKIANDKAVY